MLIGSLQLHKIINYIIQERINFHFETLFETGVDEMSWDDTVS